MNRGKSSWGLIALSLVVLVFWLWWNSQQNEPAPNFESGRSSQGTSQGATTDPVSGLPWVAAESLPPEAGQTLALIDAGGPFPYSADDETFGNFEGILPARERGYYREYTVETPGLDHRGARRIVTGSDGEFYWTDDHYESFSRIRR